MACKPTHSAQIVFPSSSGCNWLAAGPAPPPHRWRRVAQARPHRNLGCSSGYAALAASCGAVQRLVQLASPRYLVQRKRLRAAYGNSENEADEYDSKHADDLAQQLMFERMSTEMSRIMAAAGGEE